MPAVIDDCCCRPWWPGQEMVFVRFCDAQVLVHGARDDEEEQATNQEHDQLSLNLPPSTAGFAVW